MLMKMRRKMQNQKGFTLVELMVVVVILGILVAIAIPVYSNVTKQANQKAVEANLRTIDGAIMQYQASEGISAKPTEEQLMNGTVDAPGDDRYLKEWPTGPDGVTYDVNDDGKAEATIGSETGAWFGEGPHELPVTWPE